MKALIVLLIVLVASTAAGQVFVEPRTMNTIGHPRPLNESIEGTFVQHWDSYKAECLADSSLETIWGVPTTKIYGSGLAPNGHTEWFSNNKYVWRHKEPTFNGFMEYLRKLTK